MSRFIKALFGILIFLAPLLPATLHASELNIFFSNDVHGETEPCG